MQAIRVLNTFFTEDGRLHSELVKGGSPFVGHEGALFEALSSVSLPENSSLLFGVDIGGESLPLVLLSGDRVVLFDICEKQSQAATCAKCDRLASYARRISLFHKPSDGKRVHCALIVTGNDKLKPYAVHICQVLPLKKLADYLRSLKIDGQSASSASWLAVDPRDSNVILADRIEAGLERWSRFTLDGWVNDANDEMEKLHKLGYRLYITHEYSAAKEYCNVRYAGTSALYGFITSSEAENMFIYGGKQSRTRAKRLPQLEDEGWEERWFDPMAVDGSRSFKRAAFETTFGGRQLDFAILGWGDDMRWVGKWKPKTSGVVFPSDLGKNYDMKAYHRPKARFDTESGRARYDGTDDNPRLAAYYTLLTVAKEGMVLFTISDLYSDATSNALIRSGAVRMF